VVRRKAARKLEHVLDGEGVDVDDHRAELGVAGELCVVLDLVSLGGYEEQIHLAGLGPLAQNFVVDLDVLDVEGDVLLGLPLDLLGELGRGHHRHGDLADDDGLARDAHRHILGLDFLVLEEPRQGLADSAAVHDVAVDDGLRRKRGETEPHELEPLTAVLQLANLDRARTDVDPDEVVPFSHLENKFGTRDKTESKKRFT
jgi:hypothetical protein